MSALASCWPADFAVEPAWADLFVRMKSVASTPESAAASERARFDAELLRRMGRSDREAFAQLYDRFSRPLYATALRILSNAAEAEDIVQDVFLALWEKAAAFEPARGSAFAWAVTLTRNRAIDRVRMRKRRSELLAETTAEDAGTQPSDAGLHSADELVSKEQAGAVRAAVAALPAEQQRAVELAFFSGLTQQEIAEKLREPLGTVKARIRRGLLRLRDTLGGRHD
jgi:RNA polymerase sigma-70 factor (ECF subfamily)